MDNEFDYYFRVEGEPPGERLVFENPSIVMLAGLPGAGKGYLLERLQVPRRMVASADDYRVAYTDEIENQRFNEDVWRGVYAHVGRRSRWGVPTIMDTTALQESSRRSVTALTHDLGIPVHLLLIDASAEVCLERQTARGRMIPSNAFRQMTGDMNVTRANVLNQHILREGFATARRLLPVEFENIAALEFR